MAITLILYFLYFLAITIFILGVGYLEVSFLGLFKKRKTNFTIVFFSFLFGILSITVLFAAICAEGKTILAFILPLFILLLYACRGQKQNIHIGWKYRRLYIMLTVLFFSFSAFIIKFLPYVELKDFSFVTPHSDYVFYSIIAQIMGSTGQENTYTIANLLTPNCTGVSPYHYAELWLSVLVAKTFSANYLLSLIFVVYPLLLLGWILAIFSFYEVFMQVKIVTICATILLLFVSGLHFDLYYNIDFMSLTGVFSRNFLTELGDKYGFIYLLFSFSILMFNYYGLEVSILALLMIPFVFAAAVPGVFGAFPLTVVLFYKRFKNPFKILTIWALSFCGYFLFYIYWGGNAGQSNDLNIDFLYSLSKFSSLEKIRTAFNIVVGTSLQIILLYTILIIYFIVILGKDILKNIWEPYTIFIGLTFVCGLFTWAFLYEIMDMVQLVNGCGIILLNTFIVYNIIKHIVKYWNVLSLKRRYIIYGFTTLILLFQLNSTNFTNQYRLLDPYSKSYILTVNASIPKDNKNQTKFTYIANQESTFDNIFSFLSYHKLSTQFIYLYKKQILPICVDNFDVDIKELPDFQQTEAIKIKKSGYFYQFVENQRRLGQFESIDQSRLDLLDSLKVNYLSLGSNTSISPILESKFKLLTSDSSSGEQFYVRKKILE